MTDELELALIVGAARSGTTLTRLLLDAHPAIGCPAEAGIPALMAHLAQVWVTVNADDIPGGAPGDPGVADREGEPPARWQEPGAEGDEEHPKAAVDLFPGLSSAAREWIVGTVRVVMGEYCARASKRIYCDKSLDSVHHLALVRELFPRARAVLVFRHVMDTVASGIEASPWGFRGYGYAPYVQASPDNSVAALASYWLDHVDRALRWEREHPQSCYRVRYEDLVLRPEDTVGAILRFLGVDERLSVLTDAFNRQALRGPGDYKVEHTDSVHAASIGHGKRVPITMLPPRLLEAINEKLAALGYEPLDKGWNAAERLVDGGGQGLWARRLAELISEVRIPAEDSEVGSFALVAEDHRALRWVVEPHDGSVAQGDGDVEAVVTGLPVVMEQERTLSRFAEAA